VPDLETPLHTRGHTHIHDACRVVGSRERRKHVDVLDAQTLSFGSHHLKTLLNIRLRPLKPCSLILFATRKAPSPISLLPSTAPGSKLAIMTISRLLAMLRKHSPSGAQPSDFTKRKQNVEVEGGVKDGEETSSTFSQPHVDLGSWNISIPVKRLKHGSWQDEILVITQEVVAFGLEADEFSRFDDVIPLHEVASVKALECDNREEGSWSAMQALSVVCTAPDGYNHGNTYCIAMEFPMEIEGGEGSGEQSPATSESMDHSGRFQTQKDFLESLEKLVQEAKNRHLDTTWQGKFERSRFFVDTVMGSLYLQTAVAVLLIINFMTNAYEAQMYGKLELEDGSPTSAAKRLEDLDTFFTIIFTIELLLNLYAKWMMQFITDGWCIFDFIVVVTSLLSPILEKKGEKNIPVNTLRTVRAFRILRVFGLSLSLLRARARARSLVSSQGLQACLRLLKSFRQSMLVHEVQTRDGNRTR
jgi:hypothetical protein